MDGLKEFVISAGSGIGFGYQKSPFHLHPQIFELDPLSLGSAW